MDRIKSYGDWLVEAAGNSLAAEVMDRLEPTVDQMVEQAKKSHEEETGRAMSKWLEQITRMQITYDLLRSIEVYTQPTDKLISLRASGSPKGSIVIDAVIQRDGKDYDLLTDVIYAGGYNIQRLHYRYLTKTGLPKTGSSAEADKIKAEIKRLTKGEKLNREIDRQRERIAASQAKLDQALALSQEEIEAAVMNDPNFGQYLNTTWTDIVSRGADGNYPGGEAEFDQWLQDAKRDAIARWKKTNITFKQNDIKAAEREIARLEKKLDSIAK